MASSPSQRMITIGVLAFLVFGAGMAYYGYQTAIYPVDSALGWLARAETASTPEELAEYVGAAQRLLPKSGNPVWSFPTAKTDFGLIQAELDNIMSRANSISSLEPHSSDYNTALQDVHFSVKAIQEDVTETLPYIYVSSTNIVLSSVWIAVILFMIGILRKGRKRYREEFENSS